MNVSLVTILAYLALLVAVGVWLSRRVRISDDFAFFRRTDAPPAP